MIALTLAIAGLIAVVTIIDQAFGGARQDPWTDLDSTVDPRAPLSPYRVGAVIVATTVPVCPVGDCVTCDYRRERR